MFKKIIFFIGLSFSVNALEYNACFDDVGLLKPETQEQIRGIGNKLYQSGKVQFTVKIVANCNDTLTDGRDFFNKTGIGDKEKNNGLLLFVNAKNFRANKPGKVRLLTGYGMEGMFPDSICGMILDTGLLEKDIDAKILKMVSEIDAMFSNLGDNPVPDVKRVPFWVILLIIIVLIIIALAIFPEILDGSGSGYSSRGYSSGGGGFSGVGGSFGGGSCGGGGAER